MTTISPPTSFSTLSPLTINRPNQLMLLANNSNFAPGNDNLELANASVEDHRFPNIKPSGKSIYVYSESEVGRSKFEPGNSNATIRNSISVTRQDPSGQKDQNGRYETFTTHHDFQWRVGTLVDQKTGKRSAVYEIETTGLNNLKRRVYISKDIADKSVAVRGSTGKGGSFYSPSVPNVQGFVAALNRQGSIVFDTSATKDFDTRISERNISVAFSIFEFFGNIAAASFLKKNVSTRNSLTSISKTRPLTADENKALTISKANITTYVTGAISGGINWGLFSDKSSWSEAAKALLKGDTATGLTEGGKGALNLLTWTNGAGYLSNFMAGKNIQIGEALLKGKLKTGGPFNWGFFADPKAWTAAALEKVGMGAAAKTFKPFLDYIGQNNASTWLTKKGALNISDDVIASWGMKDLTGKAVTNKNQLVDALVNSKIWRVFVSRPIGGSPFVVAETSKSLTTAGTYAQLMLSRGMTSIPANLFFQSVTQLGMNGRLNINWTSAGASFLGGQVRALGAPGAWISQTIVDRLKSYGMSTFGSLVVQASTGAIVNGLKSGATISHTTGQILGNVNQATNSLTHLAPQIADGRVKLTANQKLLLNEYSKRLAEMESEFRNNKGPNLDQRATDLAIALDIWLDSSNEGVSVRSKLNSITFKPTTIEHRQFLESICIRNSIPYSETMKVLGIAPDFTSFSNPEGLKNSD
jgi:hypothetical protein